MVSVLKWDQAPIAAPFPSGIGPAASPEARRTDPWRKPAGYPAIGGNDEGIRLSETATTITAPQKQVT